MTNKLALLGKGKTGSQVMRLLQDRSDYDLVIFDRENPLTLEKLQDVSGVISFFPGAAFLEAIPTLVESGLPVVTGSTGFEWPGGREEFHLSLKEKNLSWIHGHNFSLGMNLIKMMIENLGQAPKLFDETHYHIHEVHHVHKKDAPSGTALAWKEWLGRDVEITSERTGDVVGDHKVELKTPFEKITLRHQALDRQIFAQGALWGLEKLFTNTLTPGLHVFQDVAIREMMGGD